MTSGGKGEPQRLNHKGEPQRPNHNSQSPQSQSHRPRFNWRRWLDEWRLAFSGVLLATRERRFQVAATLSFLIFGTLMHLLSGSSAAFSLFWSTDFAGKLKILLDGFLANFGVGQNFWDWLLIFVVTVLQSTLIGLVALVWYKRRRTVAQSASNADNLQSAGLAAGLAVLGTGCPTCGTTLLMPVIGTLFSTGGYALAGLVSGLLTAASLLIALFALKRIGHEAYALIVSERYLRRHAVETAASTAKPTKSATEPAQSTKTTSEAAK